MNSSDQREASWFAAAADILCVLISFLFFYIFPIFLYIDFFYILIFIWAF